MNVEMLMFCCGGVLNNQPQGDQYFTRNVEMLRETLGSRAPLYKEVKTPILNLHLYKRRKAAPAGAKPRREFFSTKSLPLHFDLGEAL